MKQKSLKIVQRILTVVARDSFNVLDISLFVTGVRRMIAVTMRSMGRTRVFYQVWKGPMCM